MVLLDSPLSLRRLLLLLCCSAPQLSNGFVVLVPPATTTKATTVATTTTTTTTSLAAGFGAATVSRKKKKNDKKKKTGGRRGGFGGATASSQSSASSSSSSSSQSSTTPFDVSASLIRLDKLYDKLSQAEAKRMANDNDNYYDSNEVVHSEYIVAARSKSATAVPDWVPIAQILVARTTAQMAAAAAEGTSTNADPALRAAVSLYCRELSHVAGMGSRVFQALARQDLVYAVESLDSFHKYVYQVVVEGKNDDANNDQVMTKTEARTVLGLDDSSSSSSSSTIVVDSSSIKKAYRSLSMQWHPDRFVGHSDDEKASASDQYARIKLAYETLRSGIRETGRSWYESLGGRERTDFYGPIDLMSLSEAARFLESQQIQSALAAIEPDLVQGFVTRSRDAAARQL